MDSTMTKRRPMAPLLIACALLGFSVSALAQTTGRPGQSTPGPIVAPISGAELKQQQEDYIRSVPAEIRNTKAFQRDAWFYGQRGLLTTDPNAPTYQDRIRKEIKRQDELRRSGLGGEMRPETALGGITWSGIGPNGLNAASLSLTSHWGVVSGRVRAMDVHPTDANTVYIGSAAGGIWKTVDGGASWSDVGASLPSVTYGAIAIDPNNGSVVYAGGGEIRFNFNRASYDGNGLFKSTNGGASWTNITDGFGDQTHFGDIVVNPNNSNEVWAALGSGYFLLGSLSNEGVWKSTDAGMTWTRSLNVGDAFDVIVHPTISTRIYAAVGGGSSNSGFWISTNGGSSWNQSNTGLPGTGSIDRMQITQSQTNPLTFYACIFTSGSGNPRAYSSTDGGASWSQISVGVQLGGNYGGGWVDQGGYDNFIAVDPSNANNVLLGNVELHRATDGANFSVLRVAPASGAWDSPCHVDYHIARFAPSSPSRVYIGSDGGVFVSNDGGATWGPINTGLSTIAFYRLASHPTNENIVIGGAQDNGNFRTLDKGTTPWANTTTGDGMECAWDYDNPNIAYQATQNGNYLKSTDGAATYSNMFRNLGGAWLSPIVVHPKDANTIFIVNDTIFKSTNKGSTFSVLAPNLVSTNINTMAVSPVNTANMIVAGSNSFNVTPDVWVSSDSGTSWSNVTFNIPGPERFISRVVFHPTSANTVYVVRMGFDVGNTVWRSTNLGTSWTDISGNLPAVPASDLVIDPLQTNEMYVANDLGVYHTNNSGTTWFRESNGMPWVPVHDLEIIDYGSKRLLRAGTHGRSAYESEIVVGCLADNTAPWPDVAVLDTLIGECEVTVPAEYPTATDDCSGTIVGVPDVSLPHTFTTLGVHKVTFTYTDDSGNVSQQDRVAIVIDTTAPVVVCAPEDSVEADKFDMAVVPDFISGSSATDNCDDPWELTWAQNPAVNSAIGLGQHDITVSAFDLAGNEGTCMTWFRVVERVEIAPSLDPVPIPYACGIRQPVSREVIIDNSGGHFNGGVLQYTVTKNNEPRITLLDSTGYEGDTLRFEFDAAGLPNGTYTYYLTITAWNSVTLAEAKNSPYQLAVIVTIEPEGNSFTDTETVTNTWTAFTNPLGQKFAEVKSNGGDISNFTIEVFPCKTPPAPPQLRNVRRYWVMSAPGAVDVDIRFYFTEPEMGPYINSESAITARQRPSFPGPWSDLGGTAVVPGNYVELAGVTNIAGHWLMAAPWVPAHPKPLALTITHASYNHGKSANVIEWNSIARPNADGFVIQRTMGDNPAEGDWYSVGSVEYNSAGTYSFEDKIDVMGTYNYRLSIIGDDGTLRESGMVTLEAGTSPEGFWMAQNYPNPFNPETSIQYHLPGRTEITLKVYDLSWREVATLAEGVHDAGTYEARFSGSNLPSGTYIYQLKAGEFIQTRKMNLLK